MRRSIWGVFLVACGVKVAPVAVDPMSEPTVAVAPELHTDAVAGVSDPPLRQLLHDHWEATLLASPEWATALGDHRYDDQLADGSQAARTAWTASLLGWLARAEGLEGLDAADALTADLFIHEQTTALAVEACRFHAWSLSPRYNRITGTLSIPETLPVHALKDGENLVARLRGTPAVIDTEILNLRAGLADNLVANAHSVGLIVELANTQLALPDTESALYKTITQAHDDWDDDELQRFRDDAAAAIRDDVRPAFTRYRDFLRDEVLPVARPADAAGVGALPLGESCYQALILQHTTLERTPDQLHQTGLDALAQIHDEFRSIAPGVLQTDDLSEIFARLRTDPELYFSSEQEVEDKAVQALAAAQQAMPEWFGRLPQTACEVERIPDYEAPYTTIAYYRQPTPGERPGTYFINTYAPETRPRHEAEVLAFHESIPGHHLQIAISQELPDLPAFRKHGGVTAFVEGWALYTERLADEMGLYSGDVDRLGMLSFDAWRAGRLVVDTGVHSKGWTREQAETFLRENTPLAENNIANEVDRYITWPGQALAYKTGQIEIWRMRREAESQLGERFDLPAFHDVVLGAGAVPLAVLEARIDAHVALVQNTTD